MILSVISINVAQSIDYSDGTTYIGEAKDERPHGYGTLILKDRKTTITGEWKHGIIQRHGSKDYPKDIMK